MNYKQFKFNAQVDWIDIEFRFASPSHVPGVRSALMGAYPGSKPHVKGDMNSGTVFVLRIQAPKTFADVANPVKVIARRFKLAKRPEITALEFAVDAYPRKGTDHNELAKLTAHLYKFNAGIVSGKHRIFREFKEDVPAWFDGLVRALADGFNIGINDKDADQYMHLYVKTADSWKELPASEHRARIEVTLRGDALPVKSLADFARFRFERLSGFFTFRTLRDDLAPVIEKELHDRALAMFERGARPGERSGDRASERKTRNRAGGGTRIHHGATRADSALNRVVKGAMTRLSDRWTPPPVAKPEPIACGNLHFSSAENTSKREESAPRPNNFTTTPTFPDSPLTAPSPPPSASSESGVRVSNCDDWRDTNIRKERMTKTAPEPLAVPESMHIRRSHEAAVSILDAIHGRSASPVTEILSRPVDAIDFSCLDDLLAEIEAEDESATPI